MKHIALTALATLFLFSSYGQRPKMKIGKEVVVVRGPVHEDVGWGPYQFSQLYKLADGRIMASVHVEADNAKAYGDNRIYYVSTNNGQHWEEADSTAIAQCLLTLPSGDALRPVQEPSLFIDAALAPKYNTNFQTLPFDTVAYSEDGNLPRPVAGRFFEIWGLHGYCYLYETLPKGLVQKAFPFLRRNRGAQQSQRTYVPIEWDNFSVFGWLYATELVLVKPFTTGRLRLAPDGTLWLPHGAGELSLNPSNGAYINGNIAAYLQSTDNGNSFKLVSFLEHTKNSSTDPKAYVSSGFAEPDIAFMPDGSIITLLRTTDVIPSPLYFARSADSGKTWSEPIIFDDKGVLPTLCTLACGVTLASYGRPGIYIRITHDKSGVMWEDSVALYPPPPPIS